MEISFEGIGQVIASFQAESEVQPGMAVAVTGNGTVGLGTAGDPICGKVIGVRGGMAAVQISGMTQLDYSGTAPALGGDCLTVDGSGKVKQDTEHAANCRIVSVNTADNTVVIML